MLDKIWTDLFVLGLPVAEKVLRPVIIYFFLVLGLRFAGKRELAQLNPFDFVVLMTLSNTVQNGIIGDDNSVTGAILGAGSLLLVNYVVVRLLFDHEKLEHLVEGDPTVLIDGGRVLHDRLKAERITRPELESAAHKQGFAGLDELDRAVLEPGGTISFFRKKPDPDTVQFQALTARLDGIASTLAEVRSAMAAQRPA
jgi:uncharacterized membrane protein YcaP (DUF421 family)